MDPHSAQSTVSSIGSTSPHLDAYTVGARRERRPVADVYDAVHRYSGAPHVLYVLRPRAMQDHALVHRIGCEVDAARWIRHPAVPMLDRQGETPSRRLYVAVEERAGRTLRAAVAADGRITPDRLVRIAGPLVEALELAHAVGLVHGRLTPDVVLIADHTAPDGTLGVTLTGLGLASVAGEGELTTEEQVYVSPEQRAGHDADARSDVFGLASLLAFAYHGTTPVPRDGDVDVDGRSAAARVLDGARSADPQQRPASVKAFWEALLAALVSAGATPAERHSVELAVLRPTLSAPMAPTRRRRPVRAYSAYAIAATALALGWPLARGGARPAGAQTAHATGEVALATARPTTSVRAASARVDAGATASAAATPTETPVTRAPATRTSHDASSSHANAEPAHSKAEHAESSPAKHDAGTPVPHVEVPTFVIITGEQATPRPVMRTGEFGDRFDPTRRTP